MNTLKITWSLVLAGAVVTAACGDSKSSMNPVAPSAVVSGVQSEEAGDPGAVSGVTGKGNEKPKPDNGNGNGNGNGGNGNGNGNGQQPTVPSAPQPPTNTTPGAPGLGKVEIEGLISAKGGNTLIVNAQVVVVPASCPIRHGSTQFTFADLHVGDRVHVKASRATVGSGSFALTTLEATEVKLQNPGDGGGEGEGETPTNLVSVSAVDALATETGANTGAFRLTRSGSAILLAAPLTVTFTLTGTATNGTDYTNVPLTATFPASLATVDVIVTPIVDPTTEGPETAIFTLASVAPYELGAPATATVTITDTDSPLVSVTAFDSTASETPGDTGTFRFSRTGSTAASLTVTFTVGGTASAADYAALPASVTFPAGASTMDLTLTPVADPDPEAPESVILTVTDGATYDVGAPAAATVTITG
jgi:Calx-beta domain